MKAMPIKIVLVALAAALTIGLVSWLKVSKRNAVADTEKITVKEAAFSKEHLNWVKTDTFIRLLNSAYHPNVKTAIADSQLVVSIEGANEITKDFYNGNEALLKYELNQFGFKISYDKNNNSVYAKFKIQNNAVPVPNDILIKIADKTTN
ncbi:hypothetical protein DBR32_06240 [Taibaiella sp. KBW10]|uniref:hypothetical protein n=1 Tax=Taibaiella sp. KBW10 TaxID=2153357 RepID=UPI000F596D64|nr:hypothetical protein [Taibaiella sp. KBW10]RQO31554.1 hypothetical protein DBR32_06240 [Taibaiella sp. KBW10]